MAAHSTVPPALVAAISDRYELLREVGRGGSATVYLARDLKHDRQVAVKVLHDDLGDVSSERFLLEIRVSAGMQHPHILPTYDSGIADGRLYFVMPFVDGGSLRDRLAGAGSLPTDEALSIACDIGIALAHAHDLGVIHRDVKPENILFYHGVACLADFGIARAVEEMNPMLTAHGTFVGTPAYMSPEQYAAIGFDGRTDIYSLSCVLYEMLAGTRLFSGNTPDMILAERGVPSALRGRGSAFSPAINAILEGGLAGDPAKRFPNARAFVAVVQEALRKIQNPERPSAPVRALRAMRQRKIATAIGVAAVATFTTIAWGALADDDRSSAVRLQGDGASVTFENGQAALAAWNIPQAIAHFSAADSSLPSTRLGRAESYALAGRFNRDEFRIAALRLRESAGQLHERDSVLAAALIAFASGSPANACPHYRSLIQRDSTDARAWFGLGDCQRVDSSVVRDARSRSGWRFNSSYGAAAAAYMRAVSLNSQVHAALPFVYFTRLLPVNAASVRIGRSSEGRGELFAAYPALIADTLAFVPYRMAVFSTIARSTISPTQPDAIERNRVAQLEFAKEWTVAKPGSADAWEALSLARENRGELSDDSANAGGAIRRAQVLSNDPLKQTQRAAAHLRILVKRMEFGPARTIADSLLKSWRDKDPPAAIAGILSGIAALTGRVDEAAKMTVVSMESEYASAGVAQRLAIAASLFTARAAPGICDDSLRFLRVDFERILESYSTPSRKDQLRQAAIWQGGPLAFPCMQGDAIRGLGGTIPLDRAQRAFAAGNPARARMLLDSIAVVRTGYRPGDISLDHTVQEAWLRAAIGDTAAAERQLDLVLDALPTLGVRWVIEPVQSAALGRAMVLRADLAAARQNMVVARRWAAAAQALWQDADPSLGPTLDRMKRAVAGR